MGASGMGNQKLALAGAKFRAWWDGVEFDEAAALAALAQVVEPDASGGERRAAAEASKTEQSKTDEARAVADELFDAEPDPRLYALQMIWGEGRVGPPTDEGELIAKLAMPEDGALAVLGPGLSGPIVTLNAGARPLHVFEWRAETRETLAQTLGDVKVEPFDLDVSPLAPDAYVGLISFDDFTYAGHAPHLAQVCARAVKPGCTALVECYVGPPGPDLSQAFASAFAEPQVRIRTDLVHALTEAGFDVIHEDDLTAAHVTAARAAFESLSAKMAAGPKLAPSAARELAWESETWRVRLKMLLRRRLERRRFILRRRG